MKFSQQGRRSFQFAATVLLAALLLAGCSLPAAPDLEQVLAPSFEEQQSKAAPTRVTSVRELPQLAVEPLWQKQYPGEVAATLTGAGGPTFVVGDTGADSQVAVKALTTNGNRRWRVTLPAETDLPATLVSHERESKVLAIVRGQSRKSHAYLLDGTGKILWSKSMPGTSQAAMSTDGRRLVFTDGQRGSVTLMDGQGRELSALQLGAGVRAAFVGDSHWLLLTDHRRVQLIAPDGRVDRQFENADPLNWQASVSLWDGYIGVTTGRPDNAVYLFGKDGHAIWHHLLLPGGSNEPVLDSQSQTLYVYNVGDQAGVHAYAVEEGTAKWQLAFAAPTGLRPEIRALRPTVADGLLLLHYVETPAFNYHSLRPSWQALLWINSQGKPVAHLPLEASMEASLSRGGNQVTVVTKGEDPGPSQGTTISYYDLQGAVQWLTAP